MVSAGPVAQNSLSDNVRSMTNPMSHGDPGIAGTAGIKGAIVTIDAMGCQREICKKVEKKEAYYLINLG